MKSPKNYIIVLLALTTIGGAALAWRQYQELVELRAAAMNTTERADLQKKLFDLQKSNRDLEDQLAALRAEGGDGTEDMVAAATGDRTGENGRGRDGNFRGRGNPQQGFAAIRELMSKPEVQALVSTQQKAAIDARYAALFKNLNLTPDQSDKLKSLLADRQNAIQDVFAAAREQGINPRSDPEGFRKLVTDAQNAVNDSIKSVIGDAGFQQLTSYEQTIPQRNVVNALQQRLSYTDTPLSSGQAEQLVQILAATTPTRQTANGNTTTAAPNNGGGRGPGGGFGGRGGDLGGMVLGVLGGEGGGTTSIVGRGAVPITPAAVNQAQTVLSQPQLSALQQLQQQQQTAQQLQQLVRDTMQQNTPAQKSGNTGGAGSTGTTRRRSGG